MQSITKHQHIPHQPHPPTFTNTHPHQKNTFTFNGRHPFVFFSKEERYLLDPWCNFWIPQLLASFGIERRCPSRTSNHSPPYQVVVVKVCQGGGYRVEGVEGVVVVA